VVRHLGCLEESCILCKYDERVGWINSSGSGQRLVAYSYEN
jgi:hypothetical protein